MLGRVHGAHRLRIFTAPSPQADSVHAVGWSWVGPIYRGVRGEPYDAKSPSDLWFETYEGNYIHSAFFVPSHEQFQQPHEIGEGFWGEVTVPFTYQYRRPSFDSVRYDYDHYTGYYGQVHWVEESAEDDEGRVWYRLADDIEESRQAWVQAHHIRYIDPHEFDPISPNVENKHILIDLGGQTLTAYEGDRAVFKTRIASGTSYVNPEGEEIDFSTPFGVAPIQRKRPSRRMRGGDSFGLPYDVNGVPWVTYFAYTGAAIHGAYWHNNYGLPRSHGCINVTPDAAKWVYRWSQPYMGYRDFYRWTEEGELATLVEVI
jgi:hypothetical protein